MTHFYACFVDTVVCPVQPLGLRWDLLSLIHLAQCVFWFHVQVPCSPCLLNFNQNLKNFLS